MKLTSSTTTLVVTMAVAALAPSSATGVFECCSERYNGDTPMSCFVDPTCSMGGGQFGGLGCMAAGVKDCRFCEFGEFVNIACPSTGSAPTPTPVAPDTTPVPAATEAPTPAPTMAPVDPTPAPVAPVTTAPVAPVTTAPVAPVTTAPVAPVTTAPVAPVTTAPVVPDTTDPIFECCDRGYNGDQPMQCFIDPTCSNTTPPPYGGLGCNAQGVRDCRFCEFGLFKDIPCPGAPSPTPVPVAPVTTAPVAPVTTAPVVPDTTDPIFECCDRGYNGDQPMQCFIDPTCSNTTPPPYGGLGCNAQGVTDCRFCEFGIFKDIPCPGAPSPTPVPVAPVTPVPVAPVTPPPVAPDSPSFECCDEAYLADGTAKQCFVDPSCARGGLGCNAGGVQNCRLCEHKQYSEVVCGGGY